VTNDEAILGRHFKNYLVNIVEAKKKVCNKISEDLKNCQVHTQKVLYKIVSLKKYLSHDTVPLTDDPTLTFARFLEDNY
jgi:hypothetical protein